MSNYSSSKFNDDPNSPWFKALKLIPPKSTVLDIGCSSGNFGKELIEKKECIVDGVELNERDIRLAKKKLRQVFDFNVEDGVPADLIGKYDIVYYGDVIEHLINPIKALNNTKKLLKKNGKIVFSIPNMAHISVRLMLMRGKFSYGETGLLDKTHLHFYDLDEIERLFNEAGFVIEKLDWVSRDIPSEILKKDLASLGLSATDKFFEDAKKLESSAYQYIGQAGPSSAAQKTIKRRKISPRIDMFEKHLLAIRKSYEEDVDRIHQEFNKKTIIATVSEIEKIRKNYENSRSWKLTKPLRVILKATTRSLNKMKIKLERLSGPRPK